jgi:hypothetical protein
MPSIAICPRCTSHLGLPAGADSAAQVQCPICEVEFSLATVSPRELPQARLVESVAKVDDAEHTEAGASPSPQERLSRLLRSSASWTSPTPLEEAKPDLPEVGDDASYDRAYQDADPELARQQTAPQQTQPASSRLDQLLSDLIKNPAEPIPVPTARVEPREVAATNDADRASFSATLGHDFETDFADSSADQEAGADEKDAEEEQVVVSSSGVTATGEGIPLDLRTAPRRKRRPAGVRTLVGVIGGGVLGIALGAYGLLWLQGPNGDFLGLAKWLPPAMLPSSMSSMANVETDDDVSVASQADDAPDGASMPQADENLLSTDSDEQGMAPGAAATLPNDNQPPRLDPEVMQATAEEPVADAPTAAAPTVAPAPAASTPTAWPTTPIVGDLRNVKLYSVAELGELLEDADAAHRQFLAGDLTKQQSWATMGPAYMAIAALAERYTLTDPSAYGNELITKQLAAKNIFRGTLGDPARRTDLATIAARWLQHERRQNQGVVLIGRVRDLQPNGKWTQYTIDVPLGEGTVAATVLMDRISFTTGDEVAVVGAILQKPLQRLTGYQGEAAEVVIAGYSFAPADFVAPQATSTSGLPLFGGSGAGAGE